MMSLKSLHRDVLAISSGIAILVTDNVLSGTAAHITVSVLAAVGVTLAALSTPDTGSNKT